MSNHKTPLTELERKGLEAHGLGRYIGKPSQLADAFRQGVAWALANTPPAQPAPAQHPWVGLTDAEILADDTLRHYFGLNGGAGPVSDKGKKIIALIEAKLRGRNAAPVQDTVAFKQFLSDVHTAAGLVTHGEQCKALGERLGEGVMRYTATPPAAQVQEPVAWRAWFDADNGARWLFTLWPEEERLDVKWEPLYIAAQRQWVGLTEEELDGIYAANGGTRTRKQIAAAIEAKLKGKNT